MKMLITGSAGFIGGAITQRALAQGWDVTGVDLLLDAAHGPDASLPEGTLRGDVRVRDGWAHLLDGVDVVCHQAAMVGAGQSPADLPAYAGHNDLGTAVVLAAMAEHQIHRLVLASSMVVYGEGRYRCAQHGDQQPAPRSIEALEAGNFDNPCPVCGAALRWALVDENARLDPRSSYAASKVAQEHYASAWARQTGGSVAALRYHNVYGPWMPADTPYSGVAAMFRSSLEHGQAPRVFEDGTQMRDFVHVDDIARINLLAAGATAELTPGTLRSYNVCSGEPVGIRRVAELVAAGTGTDLQPEVTGEFRSGDVRHVVADPARARAELGFTAEIGPDEGLPAFAQAPLRS